jgi:Tfp pilus assembly protein PilE
MKEARQIGSFTLIELITVIGIMALIATLSIPVYTSINKGANMRAATTQLQSATFLARQQAITLRQRMAFGIPYYISTANPYVRSNMLYRSYVIFTEETGGVTRPARIIGKIGQLPKGIVFSTNDFENWTETSCQEGATKLFRVKCFRFAPVGNVFYEDMIRIINAGPPAEFQFVLREGTVDDSGTLQYTANSYLVQTNGINSFTGRCIVK